MFKKTLGLAISILTMVLIVWGVIFLKKKNVEVTDVYQAIPMDAAIIIESRAISDIAKKWDEVVFLAGLTSLHAPTNIRTGLLFIDSLAQTNAGIKSIIETNPLIISLHLTGKEDCGAIFYIKLNQKGQDKNLIDYLTQITRKGYEVIERKYEHTKIYDFNARGSVKPGDFSCVFTNDICIFSFSSLLLESAVRQINTNISFKDQPGFSKVYGTAGKYVDANIYVNHKNIDELASLLLSSEKHSEISKAPLLANWTELDLTLKSNTLLLNGFTYSDDSANRYLNLFLHQMPGENTIEEVLPANLSAFVFLGIEDNMQFRTDYNTYLTKAGRKNANDQDLNKINSITGVNIEELMNALLDKEVALAVISNNETDMKSSTFSVLKTRSKSETKKLFLEMLQNAAKKENKSGNDFKHVYKIDNETQFDIYKFPANNLMHTLFGNIFTNAEANYFTFIDNYLVFGSSVKGLSDFIYMNVLKKTLNNDSRYKQFTEYLSGNTNLFVYCNTDKGFEYISQLLNKKQQKSYKEHFEILKKYQVMACQFNSNGEMFFTNCAIQYVTEYHEAPHTVWESMLDTITDFKPKLIINHITNEKEIFVQDLKNNIYLINTAGRILWKIPLREKIMSDIYQIDFYNNNKLQILFNTQNQLHLIDRNGNYVERYPVTLRSPATNGLALFDYEKNKDYRILIAGEDRHVYVYNKEGNIVPGWEFEGAETIINKEIQHFRIGDKDYIVFADQNRIYILDRKGNVRVPLSGQICKSINNPFILEEETTSSKARLAVTDTAGRVFYIYFDGKMEKISLGQFSSNHYFDYQDFDADGKKDYIYLDKKKLIVLNQNLKELFGCKFEEDISSPPVYYHFSQNDRKIGILSRLTNEIYLFSKDGSTYKGFPLRGYTPFSIGIFQDSGNNFNLIVGSSDGFLYNYSVQ